MHKLPSVFRLVRGTSEIALGLSTPRERTEKSSLFFRRRGNGPDAASLTQSIRAQSPKGYLAYGGNGAREFLNTNPALNSLKTERSNHRSLSRPSYLGRQNITAAHSKSPPIADLYEGPIELAVTHHPKEDLVISATAQPLGSAICANSEGVSICKLNAALTKRRRRAGLRASRRRTALSATGRIQNSAPRAEAGIPEDLMTKT